MAITISKKTAQWLYYPAATLIFLTHIILLMRPGMLASASASRSHALLNLICISMIALSWFGYCNRCTTL